MWELEPTRCNVTVINESWTSRNCSNCACIEHDNTSNEQLEKLLNSNKTSLIKSDFYKKRETMQLMEYINDPSDSSRKGKAFSNRKDKPKQRDINLFSDLLGYNKR